MYNKVYINAVNTQAKRRNRTQSVLTAPIPITMTLRSIRLFTAQNQRHLSTHNAFLFCIQYTLTAIIHINWKDIIPEDLLYVSVRASILTRLSALGQYIYIPKRGLQF